MQELRSGQARSWALNLGKGLPVCPGLLRVLMGLVACDKSKQSASGVLSWAALPPCLWFGRGFWRWCTFLVPLWCVCTVCVFFLYICVGVLSFLTA